MLGNLGGTRATSPPDGVTQEARSAAGLEFRELQPLHCGITGSTWYNWYN